MDLGNGKGWMVGRKAVEEEHRMEYVAVAEVVAGSWNCRVGNFAASAAVADAVAALAQIPVAGERMMVVVGMLTFARIVVVQKGGLAGPGVGRVSGKSL